MEAARLTAIIEARDQGVAEKFHATDAALEGMGKRVQDTAARAVRLTETIGLQNRTLTTQQAALAQTVAKYGEGSTAAERKRIAIDRLQGSLAANERRLGQTMEALARLTAETGQGGRGWDAYREIAVGALRQVGELGVSALLGAGQALANLTRQAATSYISYENLEGATTALIAAERVQADQSLTMAEAMRQSAGQAEELLRWQQALAIDSPFSEEGVARAFQMAQAYGFVSETASDADVDARRLTQAIIDYAAATRRGEDGANGVALALGQIQAKGKVSAQELNQLAERGINARDILADAFGVTTAELVRMQEAGLIPADKAVAAIVERLERDFAGAAATASQTFGGTLARIEELKNVGLREFFEGTAKAVQPALDALADTLADPAFKERIQDSGEAFGQWVLDVTEGAEVVRRALLGVRDAAQQGVGDLSEGQRAFLLDMARGAQQGAIGAFNQATPFLQILNPILDGVVRLSGVQEEQAGTIQATTTATEQYAAAYGQVAGRASEAAEQVERLGRGIASAGARTVGGGLAGLLSGVDPDDARRAEEAARERAEKLADAARDGQAKIEAAAAAHQGKLADLDRDAGRAAEDRARDHQGRLEELAEDGGRRRAEAEAQAARELAELERDGAREREELARDRDARLAELAEDGARRRAGLVAEQARREEEAEAASAEKRADIARDLARRLEDIEATAQDRREDLALSAEDRRAGRAEKLADDLARLGERFDDRRGDLRGQIGRAGTVAEQDRLRGELELLGQEEAAERALLEQRAAREEERQAAADARKLEQLERQLAREREAAQRAAERKLADEAADAEAARGRRAAEAERKLADLADEQGRALQAERDGYARRLEEQQRGEAQRRGDLLAEQATRLADLAAEQALALETERAAYAEREEEARRHLARRLEDERAAYAERLTALRDALAEERAEIERQAPPATPEGGGVSAGARSRVEEVRARLEAARAAAQGAAGGQAVTFAANSIVVQGGGSVEDMADQLRDVFIRKMRETGGGAFT